MENRELYKLLYSERMSMLRFDEGDREKKGSVNRGKDF